MAKPPQKPDRSNEMFMREVDDAVRKSDREEFMRRYGWWLLALAILVLAGWGGYIYWQGQQREQAGELAESYIRALDRTQAGTADDEALTTFAMLGEQGTVGYRAAASIMQANLLAERGDTEEALEIYGRVAQESDFAEPFRQLALLRGTLVELDELTPEQIVDRLEPLAEPGEPFSPTASELVGLAMLDMERRDEAGELFTRLARDESAPAQIRARAELIANSLGIDLDPALAEEADGLIQPAESGDAPEAGTEE